MTKAEQGFIDQYTRKLLVEWARQTLNEGSFVWKAGEDRYYEHAKAKGWVSKREDKVLSTGFATAGAFLRR